MAVKRPDIGTTMYTVWEHLYYDRSVRTGPLMEYVVCEGKVTGFFEGSWLDIKLRGPNADGHLTPYTRRLQDIGRTVFYTEREAAELARRKTEDYERRWGWVGSPDIPLRRPWEVLLKEEDNA